MAPPTFKSKFNITHVGTATAIINIDGVNFLTDPFFSPAGTEFDVGRALLKNSSTPVLGLADLPTIDAVLLSHEDHPDNLDELGRRILDGRKVLTTVDGAKNLAPWPGVRGLRPWETASLTAGGKPFQVTGTPTQHVPGNECVGLTLESESFGSTDGLPNIVYFSGDTVYVEELAQIRNRYHVVAALLNLSVAVASLPDGSLQVTMDGSRLLACSGRSGLIC